MACEIMALLPAIRGSVGLLHGRSVLGPLPATADAGRVAPIVLPTVDRIPRPVECTPGRGPKTAQQPSARRGGHVGHLRARELVGIGGRDPYEAPASEPGDVLAERGAGGAHVEEGAARPLGLAGIVARAIPHQPVDVVERIGPHQEDDRTLVAL